MHQWGISSPSSSSSSSSEGPQGSIKKRRINSNDTVATKEIFTINVGREEKSIAALKNSSPYYCTVPFL